MIQIPTGGRLESDFPLLPMSLCWSMEEEEEKATISPLPDRPPNCCVTPAVQTRNVHSLTHSILAYLRSRRRRRSRRYSWQRRRQTCARRRYCADFALLSVSHNERAAIVIALSLVRPTLNLRLKPKPPSLETDGGRRRGRCCTGRAGAPDFPAGLGRTRPGRRATNAT